MVNGASEKDEVGKKKERDREGRTVDEHMKTEHVDADRCGRHRDDVGDTDKGRC